MNGKIGACSDDENENKNWNVVDVLKYMELCFFSSP